MPFSAKQFAGSHCGCRGCFSVGEKQKRGEKKNGWLISVLRSFCRGKDHDLLLPRLHGADDAAQG